MMFMVRVALHFSIDAVLEVCIMAFDFKKEYKEFYMPKCIPEISMSLVPITLRLEERGIPTKREVPTRSPSKSSTLWHIRLG